MCFSTVLFPQFHYLLPEIINITFCWESIQTQIMLHLNAKNILSQLHRYLILFDLNLILEQVPDFAIITVDKLHVVLRDVY